MDRNDEAAERSSGAVAGPGTGVQQSESDGGQLAQHPATNAAGPGALGSEGEDVESGGMWAYVEVERGRNDGGR